jgi:NADPH-dependent 2,4-dienoyl-CoA reductase/sulfur reductase-like enzyme
MYKAVVIGGGWSGCAAAIAAKKAGAEVVLVEKTDMLLGLGNVGGIMRNNGRYTAAEENIALGADELFGITDRCSRHVNVNFPGHNHASFYDVMKVEPEVRRLLREMNIEIHIIARAIDIKTEDNIKGNKLFRKIILADGTEIEGDVFIECTGSTGPLTYAQPARLNFVESSDKVRNINACARYSPVNSIRYCRFRKCAERHTNSQ